MLSDVTLSGWKKNGNKKMRVNLLVSVSQYLALLLSSLLQPRRFCNRPYTTAHFQSLPQVFFTYPSRHPCTFSCQINVDWVSNCAILCCEAWVKVLFVELLIYIALLWCYCCVFGFIENFSTFPKYSTFLRIRHRGGLFMSYVG